MSTDRYSRQTALRFIGEKGQERISKAKIAVVGVGALGTSVAELLVRAGVGRVLLIDRDFVDESNLQRQSLFTPRDVGEPKTVIAVSALKKINPECNVSGELENLNADNAEALLKDAGLILDCTDNLETRNALNEYCYESKKPWIHSSVIEAYGYVFPINGKPCFKCLLEKQPRTCDLPACKDVGVLNSAVKIVSALQATQAFKFFVTGEFDAGLFYVNAWTPRLDRFDVEAKKDCEVCGS